MELNSSHIIYDGQTHNTDCFAICQYSTDLNSILEDILDYIDTCSLTIPVCFTDEAVVPTSVIESPTLTNILQALLDQACTGQIRVSSDDLCLGQLIEKISSEDGSVVITYPIDPNGCQSIDLSVTPATVDTSIVKFNSNTSSTASGDLSLFQIVPIVGGTLATNGSSLLLNFDVVLNNANQSVVYTMVLNGTTLSTVTILQGEYTTLSNIRLNRVNSTTMYLSGTIELYSLGVFRKIGVFNNSITVNNLDNLTLTNTFYLKTGTISTYGVTMTNRFFTMDKFTK